jgi:hypothetical protein
MLAASYIMILQLLITIVLPYKPPFNVAYSTPFPIQAIEDKTDDWSLMDTGLLSSEKNKTTCADTQNRIPYPDITAISYASDGKVLNATLWLSHPFVKPSVNSSLALQELERKYVMLIFAGSVYDTLQRFLFTLSWDRASNTWTKIIEQLSPSPGENNIFDKWEKKVLSQDKNYSGFFDPEKNYVDLSLNLDTINSPPKYSVVSYASEVYATTTDQKFRLCHTQDLTDVIHVPPPEFSMTVSPGSLTLRPGEEQKAELRIENDNSELNALIDVHTNMSKDLELNISPNHVYLPQNGMATLMLDIKARRDATEGPHTVPILARIAFPTSLKSMISGERIDNMESASLPLQSNFTVTVLPPLRFDEYLNSFYNSWLAPVSGIVGLAAVIAPLFVYLYKKKQKNGDKPNKQAP